MDLVTIRKLVKLMNEHQLVEIDVEEKDQKIRLKKYVGEPPKITTLPHPLEVSTGPGHIPSSPPPVSEPQKEEIDAGLFIVKSPLIGTFYRSPKPGAMPFVEKETPIQKGQTLCIVEAMKVMNEIKSEVDGVIVEICAKDTEPVDFNRVLFKIKTSA